MIKIKHVKPIQEKLKIIVSMMLVLKQLFLKYVLKRKWENLQLKPYLKIEQWQFTADT